MLTNSALKLEQDCNTQEVATASGRCLSLVDNYAEVFEDFFAPVSSDFIEVLMSLYSSEKQRIIELSEFMGSASATSALNYFIDGNLWDERHGLPRTIANLFNLEGAIASLNAGFWSRAFNQTDVYDYMPQARRDEWNEQIRHPLGKTKTNNSKEVYPLPQFEEQTVRGTLADLIESRATFFAERVDGIFKALSRSHITNRPEGFSKRMILNRVIDNGFVDYSTAGVINDLRCIIAKFMGRDEPKYDATAKALNVIRQHNGQWTSVDGGALNIRVYNGVGTAHIEIHQDISWRLNAVLSSIYPLAIPHKFRKKPARTKSLKDFTLFSKPLPFTVISVLANLEQDFSMAKSGHRLTRKYIKNSLRDFYSSEIDKETKKQTEDVLTAIGGVRVENGWRFDYEPAQIIDEIVCSGVIPDKKSHQYYPTPSVIAVEAIAMASEGVLPGMSWLEPQAGTGGLADLFPDDAKITCCEISSLHCKILEAKGYCSSDGDGESARKVECLDFLVMAKDYAGSGFDRIVMNPPYSENRFDAHLKAAVTMLRKDGRLVAILPSSAIGKDFIPGMSHTYSRVFKNKFSGTSVSVVILTLER